MTTITRKVYDPEGSEISALGLPCTTVTESFEGSVASSNGKISIDDAYDLEEIEIDDNHSSGILTMIANIANVQAQDRYYNTPSPIIDVISVDSVENTNIDECVRISPTLIDSSNIEVCGVKVRNVYNCSDIYASFMFNDENCMYKVLTTSQASRFISINNNLPYDEGVTIDISNGGIDSVSASGVVHIMIAIMYKYDLDQYVDVCRISVYCDKFIPSFLIDATKKMPVSFSALYDAYLDNPYPTKRIVYIHSDKWQVSDLVSNPSPSTHYGVWESTSRQVPRCDDKLRIYIFGEEGEIKLFVTSYAEAGYDMCVLGELDVSCSRDEWTYSTKDNNKRGDSISNYKQFSYTIPDKKLHFIDVNYITDNSAYALDDRGYVVFGKEYGIVVTDFE